jgi:excisionase family DNA binding protein
MTEPTRQVLSVTHAAEYLDCSADHVRNLMSDGQIRYLDIGRGRAKIRIPIADLNDYVEKGLRTAQEVSR